MNSIPLDLITGMSQSVKSSLQNDIVSLGELRQIIKSYPIEGIDLRICIESLIAQLLAEDVQIGYARNVDGKHVAFIAWKGALREGRHD